MNFREYFNIDKLDFKFVRNSIALALFTFGVTMFYASLKEDKSELNKPRYIESDLEGSFFLESFQVNRGNTMNLLFWIILL